MKGEKKKWKKEVKRKKNKIKERNEGIRKEWKKGKEGRKKGIHKKIKKKREIKDIYWDIWSGSLPGLDGIRQQGNPFFGETGTSPSLKI